MENEETGVYLQLSRATAQKVLALVSHTSLGKENWDLHELCGELCEQLGIQHCLHNPLKAECNKCSCDTIKLKERHSKKPYGTPDL